MGSLTGDQRLRLRPAKGFKSQNATVTVSGTESFAIRGNWLEIRGAQQQVLISVDFVRKGGGGRSGRTEVGD